jgi:hypothetical protein
MLEIAVAMCAAIEASGIRTDHKAACHEPLRDDQDPIVDDWRTNVTHPAAMSRGKA